MAITVGGHICRVLTQQNMNHKYLFLIAFAALATQPTYGQWINCSGSSIPGELDPSATIVVPIGGSTSAATYSVTPSGDDTPTHEFAITRSDVMALDNLGFELLGADDDGAFNPADFGLLPGEGFCITPVSYNKPQIQTLLDSIFINNVTCCQILNLASEGFCDTLTNLGYTSGDDIQDLNDVYRVIRLFASTETISLEGFVFQITEVNNAGTVIPENCGAQAFPFCYAVKYPYTQQCFNYGPLSVTETSAISALRTFYNGAEIEMEVQTLVGGTCSLEVTDLSGRSILRHATVLAAGKNRIALPFASKGMFLVQLHLASGQDAVGKLIVH